MDNFLETYNLSKLSEGEKTLNRPIIIKEIESVAKNAFAQKHKIQIIL